tara:strand:- start:3093 stop:3764 length:672 start_codon:yes stop_codon:yes gene_type:complete
VINYDGKLGLLGLLKLTGCPASESQLSWWLMSELDEKLYSSEELLLLSTVFLLILELNCPSDALNIRKGIVISIPDPNELGLHFDKQNNTTEKYIKTKNTTFKNDKLFLFPISFVEMFFFCNSGMYCFSIYIFKYTVPATNVPTKAKTELKITGKNCWLCSLCNIKDNENINKQEKDKKVLYVLISLFIFFIVKFSINTPFDEIYLILIITLYLASRGEYARK